MAFKGTASRGRRPDDEAPQGTAQSGVWRQEGTASQGEWANPVDETVPPEAIAAEEERRRLLRERAAGGGSQGEGSAGAPAPGPAAPPPMPPGMPGLPPMPRPPMPPGTGVAGTPGQPPGQGDFGTTFKPWETIDSRVSVNQWKAWEKFRDPACPPDHPYKAERTQEDGSPVSGCLEKPVDCPPGMTALDLKGRNLCVPVSHGIVQQAWGGEGGAPGGGGGGAPGAPGRPPMPGGIGSKVDIGRMVQYGHATHDPNSGLYVNLYGSAGHECWQPDGTKVPCPPGIEKTAAGQGGSGQASGGTNPFGSGDPNSVIWAELLKRLNAGSRYTPEVMSQLQAGTKMRAESARENQTDQALSMLARRGMARAPNQNATFRNIDASVSQQVMDQNTKVAQAKIDADYQDKQTALQQALDWLNSLRDYTARMTATQYQKEQSMAQIQLGYAQIQQQMEALNKKYREELNQLKLGQAFTLQRGALGMG